jgi:hypothetical protein
MHPIVCKYVARQPISYTVVAAVLGEPLFYPTCSCCACAVSVILFASRFLQVLLRIMVRCVGPSCHGSSSALFHALHAWASFKTAHSYCSCSRAVLTAVQVLGLPSWYAQCYFARLRLCHVRGVPWFLAGRFLAWLLLCWVSAACHP